jgi:hypothetical protein
MKDNLARLVMFLILLGSVFIFLLFVYEKNYASSNNILDEKIERFCFENEKSKEFEF